MSILSAVFGHLDRFGFALPDDATQSDLELVCLQCGGVVCDVEPPDTLGVLARTAAQHVCP